MGSRIDQADELILAQKYDKVSHCLVMVLPLPSQETGETREEDGKLI